MMIYCVSIPGLLRASQIEDSTMRSESMRKATHIGFPLAREWNGVFV